MDYTEELEKRIKMLEEKISAAENTMVVVDEQKALYMNPEVAKSKLPGALAPIQHLLDDDNVNDILINGYNSVYIERDGRMQETDVKFSSEEELINLSKIIVASVNRVFDPERPYIDARLPDGSRVNIATPPLTLDGTAISIRKFPDKVMSLEEIGRVGAMSKEMSDFLKLCAKSRVNILIVGGTGSGKTTMLNAISQHIGEKERVVTIEDSAELRLPIRHKVRMESKPKIGRDDESYVTIRDLTINALRMRPDRIIIGEVRGEEAFDMIQAINTGHEGSMTTIHANSPREAMVRLESMITQAAPSLPSKAIKQRIVSAIDLLVMVNRMDDGSRVITRITEVMGMEQDTVTTQDLFEFTQTGSSEGSFKNKHVMPRFSEKTRKADCYDEMTKIFNLVRPSIANGK